MTARLGDLQPWLLPWAQRLLCFYPELTVTSVWRSWREQRWLYQRFLMGEGPYPVAPPGRSLHEYRRAFDVTGPRELIELAGLTWESWRGRWGGRFGDPIHFEA